MILEWDEPKNRINLRKHGLDFVDAEEVFRGALIVEPDVREDYGEDRWRGLGAVKGRIVQISFATRGPEMVRVISLRKATSRERKEYEEAIKNGLEAH
jgi:uncharacterized protein